MVIANLRLALTWDRFSVLMGSALQSGESQRLRYDLSKFPQDWTRRAPKKSYKRQRESRPSRKQEGGYQATKNFLWKSQKHQQIDAVS